MKADNTAENERKRQSEGVTLGRLSPQLHKSQTHTHTHRVQRSGSAVRPPRALCVCVSQVENSTTNPSGLLHKIGDEH